MSLCQHAFKFGAMMDLYGLWREALGWLILD
jgi:hypothetical protein